MKRPACKRAFTIVGANKSGRNCKASSQSTNQSEHLTLASTNGVHGVGVCRKIFLAKRKLLRKLTRTSKNAKHGRILKSTHTPSRLSRPVGSLTSNDCCRADYQLHAQAVTMQDSNPIMIRRSPGSFMFTGSLTITSMKGDLGRDRPQSAHPRADSLTQQAFSYTRMSSAYYRHLSPTRSPRGLSLRKKPEPYPKKTGVIGHVLHARALTFGMKIPMWYAEILFSNSPLVLGLESIQLLESGPLRATL